MSDFGDTKVFDLASGKELLSIDRPSKYFTFEGIGATSTNITRWCSNKVYIYDIRSRAIVMNVPFERNYSMQSLAASTDGSMAISLKSGKTIEMLQLTEGKLRSRRVWSLPDVLAVGITPEGSQGVAITKTNIVVLNLEADVITSFPREEPTVGSVRFRGFTMSEDRSVVLYGLDDFTARVLRVCPERTTVGYEWRAGSTVRGCSIDAQGTVGAFGSMSGIVEIHDLSRSCIPKVAGYHRGRVQRVGITADGRRAFSWSTDKEIRVWDVATGECERMLRGDSDFRATKTLKERFVLSRNTSLNRDGGEFSIDGTNRRFIYPNTLHDVVHYALLPDCSMAVTGTRDRTLRLWDTRTAECIAAYPCETSIGAVAVSQRTPYRCVVGLASGQVQFFEIRNL
jgi:WD40 repeat protein